VYAIVLDPEFAKQANSLHPKRYKQIHLRVFALQNNPRPPDSVSIDPEMYRVRVGPYIITYEVDDSRRHVRVFLLEESQE
jgi:mRNA-degrading endonuclease RelE of RelBE toxin-antitoxin system